MILAMHLVLKKSFCLNDVRYAARQKYSSLKSRVKNLEDRYSDIRQILDDDKKKSTTLFTTITRDGLSAEDKFEQVGL